MHRSKNPSHNCLACSKNCCSFWNIHYICLKYLAPTSPGHGHTKHNKIVCSHKFAQIKIYSCENTLHPVIQTIHIAARKTRTQQTPHTTHPLATKKKALLRPLQFFECETSTRKSMAKPKNFFPPSCRVRLRLPTRATFAQRARLQIWPCLCELLPRPKSAKT